MGGGCSGGGLEATGGEKAAQMPQKGNRPELLFLVKKKR